MRLFQRRSSRSLHRPALHLVVLALAIVIAAAAEARTERIAGPEAQEDPHGQGVR